MEYQSLMPNIGVKDVNETINFYTGVLGFNLLMNVPETLPFVWAMVGSGNVTIAFQETQNLQDEYPGLKGKPANATLTFYIKMKDMNVLYEKIKATSFLVKELHKTFYGADEFAFCDNNGYILTVTEDQQVL